MADDRKDLLQAIYDEVLVLDSTPLYAERIKNGTVPVIGDGNAFASVMLVGEAPGAKEAQSGKPFIGAAGKVLNQLLDSIALKREDIYITSVVKDRPPGNRNPTPQEIVAYGPFLERQIEIIQPRVIATLGKFGMEYVMIMFGLAADIKPIGVIHGSVFKVQATYGPIVIIPSYHPAAAIYRQKLKDTLVSDFQILKQYL